MAPPAPPAPPVLEPPCSSRITCASWLPVPSSAARAAAMASSCTGVASPRCDAGESEGEEEPLEVPPPPPPPPLLPHLPAVPGGTTGPPYGPAARPGTDAAAASRRLEIDGVSKLSSRLLTDGCCRSPSGTEP